jgi:uncharacterized protein YdaU (DUF1376 family)
MHYYKHHIGDFRRDTASLSDTDAMAYLKLLWLYYDTEQPLPANPQLLAFKIGSNAESVQLILDAFFTLDGEVYRQKRCDSELEEYRNKGQKARDSANARWNNANAMRTHNDGNAKATKIDANHKPITNNQEKTITRPEDVSELIWKDWLRHRKGLKASVTDTVINRIRKEAGKAGMPLESVFELMCARGWRGFEADWVKKSAPNDNFMGRKVL